MSSVQMQTTIASDATVQSLVSTFTLSETTQYMIFDEILIPSELPTDTGAYSPSVEDTTVNHFDVTVSNPTNTRLVDRVRQVSCRAYTQADAEALRDAVYNALQRVRSADGKAFFVCSIDPILPPSDKTDNYNAPLSVRTLNIKN